MSSVPALRESKFPHLDKLRAFAALSVVLYHVIEHGKWTTFPIDGPLVWGHIGWMGVDLFFVISGFVIYLNAFRLRETFDQDWGRVFALHRLARIAPLYLMTLILYACLVEPAMLFWPLAQMIFQGVTHALFIHNLFPSAQGAINGVNWSIGVEMQFYLFMFLAMPWLTRAKIWQILLVLCGIACLWKGMAFFLTPAAESHRLWFLTTQLPGDLDEFAFGIAACKLVLDQNERASGRNAARGIACIVAALLTATAMFSLFWTRPVYWDSWAAVIFFRSLMGLCGATIILAAIHFPFGCGRPGRLLSRAIDYLGEISYGIYLWHLPVIMSLKHLHLDPGVGLLAATVIATIVLASLSFHLVERPWMQRARVVR